MGKEGSRQGKSKFKGLEDKNELGPARETRSLPLWLMSVDRGRQERARSCRA